MMGKFRTAAVLLALSSPLALAAEPATTAIFTLQCGTEFNRNCQQAAERVARLVEARIQEQVLQPAKSLGYYHLKDLLVVPQPGSSPKLSAEDFQSSHQPFPEVCSLNGNRFTGGAAEEETNHLGRGCGAPDTIECRTSSTGEIRAQLIAGTGTREEAHLRGAFIEALDCVSREITTEIRDSRELRIPGDEASNPCLKFMSENASIRQKLTELASKNSADNKTRCRFTPEGGFEQAGCYAESALEASDALFAAVAACEAFRRADLGFLSLQRDVHSIESRRKLWTKHAEECSMRPTCESFGNCVHGKYREEIRKQSSQRFPKSGEGAKCRL
jgi:hypothetical protein